MKNQCLQSYSWVSISLRSPHPQSGWTSNFPFILLSIFYQFIVFSFVYFSSYSDCFSWFSKAVNDSKHFNHLISTIGKKFICHFYHCIFLWFVKICFSSIDFFYEKTQLTYVWGMDFYHLILFLTSFNVIYWILYKLMLFITIFIILYYLLRVLSLNIMYYIFLILFITSFIMIMYYNF